MKKKIDCICLILMLLGMMCGPVHAAIIQETMEEKELIGGVVYRHIQRLENSGWQDIYTVQADLKAPGVKLEVLKSNQGESYMETVSKLAVDSGAIAALNADFFAAKRGESGRGSAVGVEIRDGELKSSASVTERMNTLYQAFDSERFYVDAFQFHITLQATNGKSDQIKLVNKYDDLTGIVMYTDDWADTSVGSEGGIIEVAVDKNGKVIEKVTESAPIQIPEGGYVLSAHMSYNTFLLDYVHVGDIVSFDITSSPNIRSIETAVGGGAVLVKEGKIPSDYSHNVSGRNPRSAVGLDESGTVITLVAVDGRRSDAKGMTQKELGELMLELGCYTALNFDGGGSTAMVVEQHLVNTPSNGSERKVTNALGVVTQMEKNAPVTDVELLCADSMFAETSLLLDVVGKNKYRKEAAINKKTAVFKADSGKIEGNLFYPDKAGRVNITVSSGRLKDEKEIIVYENPREIHFAQEKINIKSGETYSPVLIGTDQNGNSAEISLRDVSVSASKNHVAVSDGAILGKHKGSAVITASFGNVTAHMAVMVDGAAEISVPENQTIADTQNTEKDLYAENAYRFAVFGNTREGTTLFDRFLMNRALYSMRSESKFQVFLGANIYEDEIKRVSSDYVFAKNYNCFRNGISTFITIPNVSGEIYQGDTSVWSSFIHDVKTAEQNLFIFIDRNFISNRMAEKQAFASIVNEAAESGKNVYVFGGGFVNENTISSKVRYVNTAGIFPSIALEGTSPSYVKYVLVTVNGSDVTFAYKPIIGE